MEKNNKPTYKVEFKQDVNSCQSVLIADNIPQMDKAVELALLMHRISNTPHFIYVIHDDIIDVTFIRYESLPY